MTAMSRPLDPPSSNAPATTEWGAIGDVLPAVMDALADPMLVIDQGRHVVGVNRRYLEVFGRERVDLTGSLCTDALHHADARDGSTRRCVVCDVLERGVAQRRLLQVDDASGVARRFEIAFIPFDAPADRGRFVVEVWRDIGDRSQLEIQLSHSERLASAGMVAAGVAHEINNPLASMMAGIEVLGRWLDRGRFDPASVTEARETVTLLEREAERCRDTTEKLSLLGRSYGTVPCWVDLNRVVRDTLTLLRHELRKRKIEVVEELAPELPPIWAHEAAMREMCMNLAINAVQASSGGGRVTATTQSAADHVTIVIADTGAGISPEHLARIWDPFFTTKPVGQGTGLGLTITNRIVTQHGGRIEVESAPGKGASFSVELPVHGPGGEA
jgi:PAS domain S-box-containing protein